jgi:PAS domain S-box-containing protein
MMLSMNNEPAPFQVHVPMSNHATDRQPQQVDRFKQGDYLFRLLVSSVKDYAIFIIDPDGYVLSWNEGAQRIKGYQASEIIGKHFSIFYTSEAVQSGHPMKELALAQQHGRYEEEGWRLRKDQSEFWANVVITPLYSDQKLVGFAKVTRDLTERRQTEIAREEAAKMLMETNEELQRLAYVVSHELQAPISTVLRYLNLLKARYQDRLGPDANDFMAKISDSTKLLARMIDDLWTYARVTKPNLLIEQVSMNSLIVDVLSELADSLGENEVKYADLPSIRGNRENLTFLFREILRNAIKYRSAAPPCIHIDAKPDKQGILFSVKDNGIGIDQIFSSDIFKLFHRLRGGPEATSTGMGLAICRKIVEEHKGKIWFEPATGQGTIFFIWLPKS